MIKSKQYLPLKEAIEQCKLIFLAIMTQTPKPYIGTECMYWDKSSSLDYWTHNLFLLLVDMINTGNFSESQSVYKQIKKNYILRSTSSNTNRFYFTGPSWKNIFSQRMFNQKPLGYQYRILKIKEIFSLLFILNYNPPHKLKKYRDPEILNNLLDTIINISLQTRHLLGSKKEELCEMRANLSLVEYLNTIKGTADCNKILQILELNKKFIESKSLSDFIIEHIETKLNLIANHYEKGFLTRLSDSVCSFFGIHKEEPKKTKKFVFPDSYKQEIRNQTLSYILDDIFTYLEKNSSTFGLNYSQLKGLKTYLKKLDDERLSIKDIEECEVYIPDPDID